MDLIYMPKSLIEVIALFAVCNVVCGQIYRRMKSDDLRKIPSSSSYGWDVAAFIGFFVAWFLFGEVFKNFGGWGYVAVISYLISSLIWRMKELKKARHKNS